MTVVTPRTPLLEMPAAPVDTVSMDTTALPTDQQELICILSAYQAAQQTQPAGAAKPATTPDESGAELPEAEEETGWIPRLRELPGIAAERLAPLHGQLIAHGLLKFNLLGRSIGVGYRVTPEGRDLLNRFSASSATA